VTRRGAQYGRTERNKGKRVIIEHTSSNPNAPLHIGNLRNSLLGSHLAEIMRATGALVLFLVCFCS
jgi:arginyl-tRNA synthetase